MKKSRLAILSAIVISVTVGSLVSVSLIRAQPSVTPIPPLFIYTVKWICNAPVAPITQVNITAAEDIGLVPGEYKTDVNIHNGDFVNAIVVKKFVVSVPESPFVKGVPPAFASTVLAPDAAFRVDCGEIAKKLSLHPLQAAKGFLVMFSTTPLLDVIAEYSGLSFNSTLGLAPPLIPTGHSLDLERVSSTACPIPFITASTNPVFLIIQRTLNGQSVVTVSTASGAFVGVVTLVPAIDPVNVPGLSLSMSAPQLTLGGKVASVTSTLTVGTTGQTPPGTYDCRGRNQRASVHCHNSRSHSGLAVRRI